MGTPADTCDLVLSYLRDELHKVGASNEDVERIFLVSCRQKYTELLDPYLNSFLNLLGQDLQKSRGLQVVMDENGNAATHHSEGYPANSPRANRICFYDVDKMRHYSYDH